MVNEFVLKTLFTQQWIYRGPTPLIESNNLLSRPIDKKYYSNYKLKYISNILFLNPPMDVHVFSFHNIISLPYPYTQISS